jgi:hypothetical protein
MSLPLIFMSFAIGLLNELAERLEDLGKVDENQPKTSNGKSTKQSQKSIKQKLIKCIEIHKKILEYINGIATNFSTVFCIQGIVSSFILCACAFTMSVVSNKKKIQKKIQY